MVLVLLCISYVHILSSEEMRKMSVFRTITTSVVNVM